MKNKVTKSLLAAIILAIAGALPSCQITRFVVYNFADITDHKIFPAREIKTGPTHFVFPKAVTEKAPKPIPSGGNEIPFDQFLEANETVAFLVIRNDSILYERYLNDYRQESVVASFSMAKSVTSMLIGCAIDDGFIKSVNEPVTNYIPELKKNGFENVTIKHLLQMTSGVEFNESYVNPFGDAASFYYGRQLRKKTLGMKLAQPPGQQFEYTSGSTQLLGLALERALPGITVSAYLQQKIWLPLQMEYDATWSLDKEEGLEKTFCCLNARARDFAKLGRLYLHKGRWNGKQIISEKWVQESVTPELKDGSVNYYKYQWWMPTQNGDFMAQGILGQFVYVNPAKNLIIVRLGKDYGNVRWSSLFPKLAEGY